MSKVLESFAEEVKNDERKEKIMFEFIEQSNKQNRDAMRDLQKSTAATNAKITETLDIIGKAVVKLTKK